ncbi:DUF6910 family protein [Cellulomonas sp. NPDC055163]
MQVEVEHVTALRFDDGTPVRAASAVVAFAGGWLVAQDDATHAAWVRPGGVTPVRALPPVRGLETFEEARGTKALKPDLEAAFVVPDGRRGGAGAVVLLGSGSSPARVRGCLLRPPGPTGGPEPVVADLAPLYAAVTRRLEIEADLLNLEGACVVGDALRWFQRGLPHAGVPTASVDVDLDGLLRALDGGVRPDDVPVRGLRRYALGDVGGVGLAVTDAAALRDGTVLVSAAAEDTPDPRDDGPVVGSALAVLDGSRVRDGVALPRLDGAVVKVEGLAVVEHAGDDLRLLATVDADDPDAPSLAVRLRVRP